MVSKEIVDCQSDAEFPSSCLAINVTAL